ncbi:MAG TPA: hypothetical protein PLY93_08405, partial [Turneriella sp.]|nr:hypothetical protein [Turneriella sp.]
MNARMESIEKKIVTLENEIKALRTEFEDATRAETKNTPAGVPPQIHPTPPPRVSAKSHSSWEWLVGGNLIGKLGIVTLILSAAFFMVYALDKGWLNPWTRIALLEIASAAAAYLSYRLYKKN